MVCLRRCRRRLLSELGRNAGDGVPATVRAFNPAPVGAGRRVSYADTGSASTVGSSASPDSSTSAVRSVGGGGDARRLRRRLVARRLDALDHRDGLLRRGGLLIGRVRDLLHPLVGLAGVFRDAFERVDRVLDGADGVLDFLRRPLHPLDGGRGLSLNTLDDLLDPGRLGLGLLGEGLHLVGDDGEPLRAVVGVGGLEQVRPLGHVGDGGDDVAHPRYPVVEFAELCHRLRRPRLDCVHPFEDVGGRLAARLPHLRGAGRHLGDAVGRGGYLLYRRRQVAHLRDDPLELVPLFVGVGLDLRGGLADVPARSHHLVDVGRGFDSPIGDGVGEVVHLRDRPLQLVEHPIERAGDRRHGVALVVGVHPYREVLVGGGGHHVAVLVGGAFEVVGQRLQFAGIGTEVVRHPVEVVAERARNRRVEGVVVELRAGECVRLRGDGLQRHAHLVERADEAADLVGLIGVIDLGRVEFAGGDSRRRRLQFLDRRDEIPPRDQQRVGEGDGGPDEQNAGRGDPNRPGQHERKDRKQDRSAELDGDGGNDLSLDRLGDAESLHRPPERPAVQRRKVVHTGR